MIKANSKRPLLHQKSSPNLWITVWYNTGCTQKCTTIMQTKFVQETINNYKVYAGYPEWKDHLCGLELRVPG
jgi:hypothetical protein